MAPYECYNKKTDVYISSLWKKGGEIYIALSYLKVYRHEISIGQKWLIMIDARFVIIFITYLCFDWMTFSLLNLKETDIKGDL